MPYLLEGRDLAAGDVVDIKTAIVDELALGASVSGLGNADVAAVLVLEEHDGGPVVGLVLYEAARCALGLLGDILRRIHGDVEGVSSNDLMKMGGELHAGVDKGIRPLNNQLRACKPEHASLGGGLLREERGRNSSKSSPLHLV
jgi:hypothetical protein